MSGMENDIRDKIFGCIVGGAIGDSLGVPFEGCVGFDDLPELRAMSAISDDTQLTLASCEGIVEAKGVVPEVIAERFRVWFSEDRFTGMGASTLKAMRDLACGVHWALAGRKGEYAAGNGAAMRVAPLAFVLDPFGQADRVKIKDVCRITHDSDEAYCGALAVMIAVWLGVENKWDELVNPLEFIAENIFDTNVRDRILEFAEMYPDSSILDVGRRYGASGYVADSVPVALYGAFKAKEYGFAEAIRMLLQVGGDTDTVCSMAGQIIGANVGLSGIDGELVEQVPERELIMKVCDEFCDVWEGIERYN